MELVLLFVSLLLCVDVSSSVMMEEDAVVVTPEEEETFDSNGGGRGHFSHVTKSGHFTLGGVYCDEVEVMPSSALDSFVVDG